MLEKLKALAKKLNPLNLLPKVCEKVCGVQGCKCCKQLKCKKCLLIGVVLCFGCAAALSFIIL